MVLWGGREGVQGRSGAACKGDPEAAREALRPASHSTQQDGDTCTIAAPPVVVSPPSGSHEHLAVGHLIVTWYPGPVQCEGQMD